MKVVVQFKTTAAITFVVVVVLKEYIILIYSHYLRQRTNIKEHMNLNSLQNSSCFSLLLIVWAT